MKRVLISLLGLLGCIMASEAAPVTFIYNSTTDASAVGGSSSTPVTVSFTFDSNLANGTGSASADSNRGSYGPWNGTLQLGPDTVTLTGGTISLSNDITTVSVNGPQTEDTYEFRWDSAFAPNAFGGTSTGTLFGRNLLFFSVLILDNTNHDMINSNALPTSTIFASSGDSVHDSYRLTNGDRPLTMFGANGQSYTLVNQVPEMGTSSMLILGLAVVALFNRRRMLSV